MFFFSLWYSVSNCWTLAEYHVKRIKIKIKLIFVHSVVPSKWVSSSSWAPHQVGAYFWDSPPLGHYYPISKALQDFCLCIWKHLAAWKILPQFEGTFCIQKVLPFVEDASAMCHDKLDWNVVWQEQDLLLQTHKNIWGQNRTLEGSRCKIG